MNSSNETSIFILNKLNTNLITNYLDYFVRICAFFIHIAYLLFLVYFKEFQVRSMAFLHHVNIISLLYCIHYLFYIGNQTASFSNYTVNTVLCYISEIFWINLKFLRLYSLLLLAAYRYMSVFKITAYRNLTNNAYLMSSAIGLVWLFSIIMSFSLKYIFKTSNSSYFCYEGYSEYWLNSVLFFVFLIIFSYVVPTVIVIIMYKKIIDKLKLVRKNLSIASKESNNELGVIKKQNKIHPEVLSNVFTVESLTSFSVPEIVVTDVDKKQNKSILKIKKNKNPKEKRFAQQIILINLLTCIGSVFSVLSSVQVTLSTNPYFNFLNGILENVSPLFRITFLIIQSTIPIISIIYSPWSYSLKDSKMKSNQSEIITSNNKQ